MRRWLFPIVVLATILLATSGLLLSIRAEADDAPRMIPKRTDVKPFEYKEAKIPFYPPQGNRKSESLPKMQLPLDTPESMKHFVHPADFELKLFAGEPLIKRPICMNWDERGRLWVAESIDYPNNRQPDGKGNDRIIICEDTDGDGVADKVTVFADKLSIPTSFAFWNGGIVVHQAPHTLFLKSSKGDDVADVREVLFTGWHTYDSHAGPSNLQWGLDNWLYGMVGYAGFEGTVAGEKLNFKQGFYRFKLCAGKPGTSKPSCSKLEFLRSTSNNSWGVGFSEEGLLFGSTANGNPSMFLPIPNRYYEKVRGMSASVLPTIARSNKFHAITNKVRQVDFHGGFTAAAGHALYTARTYPKEYWNRVAFVAEPTGHLVASFVLEKDGASFKSHNRWNLLASDDEWSSPIMAEVGPDGNVWIIDWYNYIVQHNPTPSGFKTGKGNAYLTDLRDKTHGRIYRLVAKNGKPAKKITLKDATTEKLVATLDNDNMFWRKHAQRLLVERGKTDVEQALLNSLEDTSVDEIGLNVGVIHVIWTLKGLGLINGDKKTSLAAELSVLKASRHKSAGVRRNAALALAPNYASEALHLLGDPDFQVRLAALLAATGRHNTRSPELVSAARSKENLADPQLRDALIMAAAADAEYFLREPAISPSKNYDASYLEIVRIVAADYAATDDFSIPKLFAALPQAHPDYSAAVLDGFLMGLPRRDRREDQLIADGLKGTFPKLAASGKAKVIRLAKRLNVPGFDQEIEEITTALRKGLADQKQSDDARIPLARQLLDLKPDDAKVVEQILDLITPRSTPQFTSALLEALGAHPSTAAGPLLLGRMSSFTPQARATALRVLLSRPESTRQFLDAVEKGQIAFSDLPLDQKQALAAHPDGAIARRAKALLAKGGGLPNPDRQKVVDEFLPLLKKTGDVALGKTVFKKHCALCHTHSGEGAKIGPDLSGVAAHTKEHLLIDILDPSRSVEGNFRVYQVATQDGLVLNGLLASESKTTIELFDTQGRKIVVPRDRIEQIVSSPKSLMPDGFEKQLKQEELINLLEFLTERGKFVPLALDKAATIVSTLGMFYGKESKTERLVLPDWSPRTVNGVPFHFVDPHKDSMPNVILLYSPNGAGARAMPKSVRLDCNMPARTIHLLSGVSGWGAQREQDGGVALIVRLHYADGKAEDHPLHDGVHFADYIRRIDVPKSAFAFPMRGQQMRYLAVSPARDTPLTAIEFVKGPHPSAPIVLAVTVETR